jgi:polysaccharide biosynthesis/export protein
VNVHFFRGSLLRMATESGSKDMFSSKKLMLNTVMFCAMAGVGSLKAQTQSANFKPAGPGNTESAKPADTAKTSEAAKPAVVVPSGYVVGDSDVLHVNVWKEQEVSQTVVVRTDGNISLPLINEVRVSGLTPLQIQDLVAEKLKDFLNNPQVTVTVAEIHSKRAFITGEVARPGTYSLNAETTVLQLIAQAGGFTPFAKKDGVVVLRTDGGKQMRLKFKYKEVVQGKKTEQNIALHPGDTVVVP